MARKRTLGILTAGGDAPGLNAALDALVRTATDRFDFEVLGFRNGFRGLVEDHSIPLDAASLMGIDPTGGTILGTGRDKPHRMTGADGQRRDRRDEALATVRRHDLAALVCLGGGGTQKNARRLQEAGLEVLTLPKTIDNDVTGTDVCLGFDSARAAAVEALDRLRTTARSHGRVMIVEVMGHRAGWLALGAGLAARADVILLPEIPYDPAAVQRHLATGPSGLVVVAEGARRREQPGAGPPAGAAAQLADQLRPALDHELRVTVLGHTLRGAAPSAADRLLAARLGVHAAAWLAEGQAGVLLGLQRDRITAVPLDQVAGSRRRVPVDHPWLQAARHLGLCCGD